MAKELQDENAIEKSAAGAEDNEKSAGESTQESAAEISDESFMLHELRRYMRRQKDVLEEMVKLQRNELEVPPQMLLEMEEALEQVHSLWIEYAKLL